LSTHLRLGLPSGLFPSCFPINILYAFLFSPIRATCPATNTRKNYYRLAPDNIKEEDSSFSGEVNNFLRSVTTELVSVFSRLVIVFQHHEMKGPCYTRLAVWTARGLRLEQQFIFN
jgi:hypothetical protein